VSGRALEVAELRYRYGERIALDGVSLRVVVPRVTRRPRSE